MTKEDHPTDERSAQSNYPRWILSLAVPAFLAIAAVYAFSTSFSYFAAYDDEGFMMISVRGWLDGHRLYDEIISYYGPVYYFYEWFFHSLCRFPLDHDFNRFFCLLHWLVAAAALALAGGWMTRSTLAGCFIFALATLHLTPLAREPGHPQELIAVLLPVAVLVAQKGLQSRWTLPLLGVIGAALAFTKINVGAFYGFALLLTLCCGVPLLRSWRVLFWLGLVGCCALPCVIMRAHLDQAWAQAYCGQVCIAILTTAAVAYTLGNLGNRIGFAQLFQTGAAYVGSSVILIAGVLVAGSSLSALVANLITGPAKLSAAFSIPLNAPYCTVSGIAALLAAGAVLLFRGRTDRGPFVIAGAKCLYGLLGVFWLLSDYNRQLGYLLPWSWLLLVPTSSGRARDSKSDFARIFLCLQSVWQGLQAYPAPGTQAVIATLLGVLIYVLCLHDAILVFAATRAGSEWLRQLTPRTAVSLRALGLAGLLYLFAIQWCNPFSAWKYYRSVPPLELQGARYLRLPVEQGRLYHGLAQFLEAECDSFIALPGLNSLYFWTGKTPPAWLTISEVVLLSEDQQSRMIESLRKARRPLIVLKAGSAPFTTGQGPLSRFVAQGREVKQIGGFRLLKPAEVEAP